MCKRNIAERKVGLDLDRLRKERALKLLVRRGKAQRCVGRHDRSRKRALERNGTSAQQTEEDVRRRPRIDEVAFHVEGAAHVDEVRTTWFEFEHGFGLKCYGFEVVGSWSESQH